MTNKNKLEAQHKTEELSVDITRLAANRKIIKLLSNIVEKFPHWKFNEILHQFGIAKFDDMDFRTNKKYYESKFYEEPEATFKRFKKLCKPLNELYDVEVEV